MKYLLIALVFLGCHNNPDDSANQIIPTEVLDTVKTIPANLDAQPVLFETAFIKGTKEKINRATVELHAVTIGKIKIVSGRIIACDPLHMDEYGKTFTYSFPAGEFPVQLSIVSLNYEETVGFGRILFSEDPVKRWELALLEGQEPIPVESKKIHGYSVDAGVVVFMDEEVKKVLIKKNIENLGGDFFSSMAKHTYYNWRYTMYAVDSLNVAAFSTGIGDGKYATYIGIDAKGRPCRLLTDFGLFDWKGK